MGEHSREAQERHNWGDHKGACCSNSDKGGEDKVLLILNREAELDLEHGELIHSNRRDTDRWADMTVKACGSSLLIIYQYQLYQAA